MSRDPSASRNHHRLRLPGDRATFPAALIRAQPRRLFPSRSPREAKGGVLPDRYDEPSMSRRRRWGASLAMGTKEIVMPKQKDLSDSMLGVAEPSISARF